MTKHAFASSYEKLQTAATRVCAHLYSVHEVADIQATQRMRNVRKEARLIAKNLSQRFTQVALLPPLTLLICIRSFLYRALPWEKSCGQQLDRVIPNNAKARFFSNLVNFIYGNVASWSDCLLCLTKYLPVNVFLFFWQKCMNQVIAIARFQIKPGMPKRTFSKCIAATFIKIPSTSILANGLGLSIILTLTSTFALAQSNTLDFKAALKIALAQHPAVLAQRSSLESAQANLDGRKWQRFPNITLDTSRSVEGRSGNTLRIQAPVWTAGRISSEIDAARVGIDAAQFAIDDAGVQIMERVIDAYAGISRFKDRLVVADENIREHERFKNLIERRVDAQINPPADLLLAKARLSQAVTDRTQIQAQLASVRAQLEQAIGDFNGEIAPMPSIPFPSDGSVQRLAALSFSPELKKLESELSKAGHEINARKSGLFPQLAARYEDATNAYTGFKSNQFALVLVYESGGGLSALSAISEATARREALRHSIEAAKRKLVERIQSEYVNGTQLAAQAEAYKDLSRSNAEVTESYARQFAVGRKSWIELLNAQREAAQSRFQLVDATWGAQLSAYKLMLLTGDINTLLVNSVATRPSGAGLPEVVQ